MRVEVVVRQSKLVSRRTCDDALGSEQLPQTGDGVVDRGERSARRLLTPQDVDHAVGRDDLIGVDEQQGEERALVSAAEW